MQSTARDELDRLGSQLLMLSERVVEHADQVQHAAALIANSVLDIARTAEPDEVRERAESVQAGVLRAVMLLLQVNAESGVMLGLAFARETMDKATNDSKREVNKR